MSTTTNLARRAWTHYEPVHAIVYFAPEAREQLKAAGLRGGWMGYFASRSAPMGAVGPEVVIATFHNFQPAMVHRAIPDAWRFSTVERVLAARLAAADAVLRRLWGDAVGAPEVAEAAELALQAASHLRVDGRPLFAGHTGLPAPAEPHLALWHACTLLREHRFDGHIAALTGYGLDGIEALVTHVAAGKGVDASTVRTFRGWTDEEWATAEARLQERGLVTAEGRLTEEGRELRDAVERLTDRLATEPWERLGEVARERLFALLAALDARLAQSDDAVFANLIGLPRRATV